MAVLALDIVTGIVPGLANIVPTRATLFESFTAALERRLNRAGRPRRDLVLRGVAVLLVLIALALVVSLVLVHLSRTLPYGWGIEALVLLLSISGRRVLFNLRRGTRIAASEDIAEGRRLVSILTGRDASKLDNFGLARVIVEMGGVGFLRRVMVPVFWYVLLGLPGLLVARAIGHCAAAAAYRDRDGQMFSAVAAALDHAISVVPSYIAAYLIAFSALVTPRARFAAALRVMSIDAGRDAVINDGRVKGAVAGALGLALGGPFGTRGGGPSDSWIGNGRARVGQADIRQTFLLNLVAGLLIMAIVAALTLARA